MLKFSESFHLLLSRLKIIFLDYYNMRVRLFIMLSCFSFSALAQSNYAPLNEDYYQRIDRYEIKTGRVYPQIFTGVKPYKRSDIIAFTDSIRAGGFMVSKSDLFNYEYLQNDSWEWGLSASSNSKRPILKHFYKKKSDFYHIRVPAFDLHINPVLYVGGGNDSRRDENLFINTRGIEVRGMIDDKVGFYTYLTDNQAIVPSYVLDQMRLHPVVPHEGFWKNYKEGSVLYSKSPVVSRYVPVNLVVIFEIFDDVFNAIDELINMHALWNIIVIAEVYS